MYGNHNEYYGNYNIVSDMFTFSALSFLYVFTGPRCLWGPVYGSRCLYLCTRTLWNFADVTLADDDTNSILAGDANRAIWGWWLSSNRWWSSPMWAWRSPRGLARGWYRSCTEYWSWWAVIMLATIYVVGTLGGNGCHWDGGGRVGWQGGAQGGYQGVVECSKC